MSFDLYGEFDLAALESGQVIDPDDPLAPIRRPGGVNLSQSGKQTMQDLGRPPAPPRRQPARGGFATNNGGVGGMFAHPSQQEFMRAMGPGAQANTLANAAQQTMAAWDKEHDSRVAQDREARRMEHEKELMRMQLENQRLVDDGALIRSLISR